MAFERWQRLVKSPKVYIRDAGLTHALLGIENLIAAAPRGTEASFYRSSAGAVIDLLLKLPGGALWAIEIKRTTSPKVTRGFHVAATDLDVAERILVYAGDRDVPGPDDIRATPLTGAIDRLASAEG